MTKIVLLLLMAGVLAGAAGCLGPQNAGYLEGHVIIGPICPVEQINVTCPVPPSVYEARKIVVSTEGAQVVTIVDIDSTGFYRTALAPDTYIVDINHIGIDHSTDVPIAVTIIAGQTTVLNISIDTGIR
ncbi:MAG: hypothetical protein LUO93_11690 [Methanomicrobiales archaeon]|nr:hypothetical protein [Methanomicrobiales archaeon]